LIRKAKCFNNKRKVKGCNEYEFKGITPCGVEIGVHIREEKEEKDSKLFLISTF
jgi:hypothetical protein